MSTSTATLDNPRADATPAALTALRVDDWVTDVRPPDAAHAPTRKSGMTTSMWLASAGLLAGAGMLFVFHQVAEDAVTTAGLRRVALEEQGRALVRCTVLAEDADRQACKTQVLASNGFLPAPVVEAPTARGVRGESRTARVDATNDYTVTADATPVSVTAAAVKTVSQPLPTLRMR